MPLLEETGTVPSKKFADGYENVDDVVTAVAFVSSGPGLTLGVESATNLNLPGVTYPPLEEGEASAFDLSVIYRAAEESPLLSGFLQSVRSIAELRRQGRSDG